MTIQENISLKEYTTFKIGGHARFFCSVSTEADVVSAVEYAQSHDLAIFTLGGGSNVLVSDTGYPGLVIKMEMKGIEYKDEGTIVRVIARAGEDWDTFVGTTVERGLSGLENLSLIPGTVGGAPVQNIGAYGSEVKDTIESVYVYDTYIRSFRTLLNTECQFSYRDSIFKKEAGRYIVLSVTFILRTDAKVNIDYRDLREYFAERHISSPSVLDVRSAVIAIRKRKLPDISKVGTAGSFFKNPIISHAHAHELKAKYPGLPVYPVDDEMVKVSLAWIIDHICGYRGVVRGNIGTYENQALVIVNNGNALAHNVIAFAEELKKSILEKTNISAEFEVQII